MNYFPKQFEIERRFLLLTGSKSYVANAYGPNLYDKVLKEGKLINQGYVTDNNHQAAILEWCRDSGNNFTLTPKVYRLRSIADHKGSIEYILTLKDDNKPMQAEVEFPIPPHLFWRWWPLMTIGKRIVKKRLAGVAHPYSKDSMEVDAFLDRYLLIAEVEVETIEEYNKYKTIRAFGKDISTNKKYSNKNLAK